MPSLLCMLYKLLITLLLETNISTLVHNMLVETNSFYSIISLAALRLNIVLLRKIMLKKNMIMIFFIFFEIENLTNVLHMVKHFLLSSADNRIPHVCAVSL